MNALKTAGKLTDCACGRPHEIKIKNIFIGSGITKDTADFFRASGLAGKALLVADENTIRASGLTRAALSGFTVRELIWPDYREPYMEDVGKVMGQAADCDFILSVGTGSLNDICRLAAARSGKKFAIFATAPSMDGFASDSAPIVDKGFKTSHKAVAPDVIIADTRVLAAAPAHLRSAGFGDMLSKYIALADWNAARLLTGEFYCGNVAGLVGKAVNGLCKLADKITAPDEDAAAAVMECMILTGLSMAFTGHTRPASGTEHIISHYIDITRLARGEQPDFHGLQVGVATLAVAQLYHKAAAFESITAVPDMTDWDAVYKAYAPSLKSEISALNDPPITAGISRDAFESAWQQLRSFVNEYIPSPDKLKKLLVRAGCPTDFAGVGVEPELAAAAVKYHPYMRRRMTLMRMFPHAAELYTLL